MLYNLVCFAIDDCVPGFGLCSHWRSLASGSLADATSHPATLRWLLRMEKRLTGFLARNSFRIRAASREPESRAESGCDV
jgi:hypothetical protein